MINITPEVIIALLSSPVLLAIINKIGKIHFNDTNNYEQNSKIFEHMSRFRHMFGISRLALIMYHNGGKFYSGKSQDKFTMEYESIPFSNSKIQMTMQGQSVGLLEDLPFLLEQKKVLYDKNISSQVNQIPARPMYYKLLQQYNVEHSISIGLYQSFFFFGELLKFKNPWKLKMIGTIFFHWDSSSTQWPAALEVSQMHRDEFLVELLKLADLVVPNRWQNPNRVKQFNDALLGR